MNWIQDCSISSTLECWPDKLQTCNCRSKWSVNACLSCSGKAFFRAQLNARRHKEEVLHQCVWSNSSILHLIPAAERVKRCNSMFAGSESSLHTAFEAHCPCMACPLARQKGAQLCPCLAHTNAATLQGWEHRALPASVQQWVNTPPHHHTSITALPAHHGANPAHKLQLLVWGRLKGWY